MRHLTFWISPSLSDRSAESLSETAVTHRPQGVIIVGIYMSSNILLLLCLNRKVLCRRIFVYFVYDFI